MDARAVTKNHPLVSPADFPVVPFVPNTWGGADALPEVRLAPYGAAISHWDASHVSPQNNPNGATASAAGVFQATSGPRTLAPAASSPPPLVYLFDVALTPSKQVNWTRHWHTRAIQVGYGTDYISPQDVAAQGATVVTLHQVRG